VNPAGAEAERRVRLHYRLRGYRILAANARAGGNELDIVARRGRLLVFCEVKFRAGRGFGDPWEAVGPEKVRRITRAAEAFLARHQELRELDVVIEVAAVRRHGIERVRLAA
jgi:putative endonuclease